jgi:Golgi nucleoside diphosphatase
MQLVNGRLDLDTDTFESLKPGLSSYDSDPAAAAKSLDPLLQTALKTVPDELQVQELVHMQPGDHGKPVAPHLLPSGLLGVELLSLSLIVNTSSRAQTLDLQRKTPIKVGATAGLRLLPGGKADDILAAVKQHLADDYPFQLEQVTIIDGEACFRKQTHWTSQV